MVAVDKIEETRRPLAIPSECSDLEKDQAPPCDEKILWSDLDRKCRLLAVFLGCCALHFIVFGMHYSFGAMFTKLLTKFNKGQGQTGNYDFEG